MIIPKCLSENHSTRAMQNRYEMYQRQQHEKAEKIQNVLASVTKSVEEIKKNTEQQLKSVVNDLEEQKSINAKLKEELNNFKGASNEKTCEWKNREKIKNATEKSSSPVTQRHSSEKSSDLFTKDSANNINFHTPDQRGKETIGETNITPNHSDSEDLVDGKNSSDGYNSGGEPISRSKSKNERDKTITRHVENCTGRERKKLEEDQKRLIQETITAVLASQRDKATNGNRKRTKKREHARGKRRKWNVKTETSSESCSSSDETDDSRSESDEEVEKREFKKRLKRIDKKLAKYKY